MPTLPRHTIAIQQVLSTLQGARHQGRDITARLAEPAGGPAGAV